MKIAKRYLLLVAALGFCYLATTTDSDTIQAHSRRNIEQSRFGILFRQVYNNPGAKIYRNGEGRTANYKDTLDIGDGMLYVVEGKARDINPVNVRNVGDEISGKVTSIGDSKDGKFTIQTPLLEQVITPGFFGSLNLSSEIFVGEGIQADLDRFYGLLEKSLNKHH